MHYLSTSHAFVEWFGVSLALTLLFALIYLWITPQDEIKLIREGNSAAAVCLSGTLLGYVLPLASVMVHGVDIYDFMIWGGIAMGVQIVTYILVRTLVLRDLTRHIEEGRVSVAIFAATISLTVGVLNAAAQSG